MNDIVLSDVHPRNALFWVLVGSLLLRIFLVQPLHANGYTGDEREYIALGEKLARGEDFIDSDGNRSQRSPLFPALLAGIFMVGGTGLSMAHGLGAVLGMVTVLLGYGLSLRLFKDRRAALATAVTLAVYPGLVIYSTLLQTESLYLVFFLGTFLVGYQLLESPRALGGVMIGLLSGLAALTRAVFLVFFPFLVISLVWMARRRGVSIRLPMTVAVITMILVILPWTIRNYHVHDRFVPISSLGGTSFLIGNNPYSSGTWKPKKGFYEWLDRELMDRGLETHKKISEVTLADAGVAMAFEYIVSNPAEWAGLMVKKAHMYWIYPITNSDEDISLQAIAVLTDIAFLVFSAIGMIIAWPRWREMLPLLAAIVVFAVVHIGLHAEARYRLPIVPVLSLFTGPGLVLAGRSGGITAHLKRRGMRVALLVVVLLIFGVYVQTGMMFLHGRL
jgi:4-amino-4-deoxy-L-arabinose transferase-like glycosyltransferase